MLRSKSREPESGTANVGKVDVEVGYFTSDSATLVEAMAILRSVMIQERGGFDT